MGKSIRLWLGPAIAVVVLAILVVALRATGGAKKPAGGGTAKAPGPTILSIKSSDVVRLEMTAGGKTLTLVRVPPKGKKAGATSSWHVGSATGPVASSTKVDGLLFGVEPLTANRSVTIAPHAAGLQPPAKVLSLGLKNGSTTVLQIGAAAPVGGAYARIGNSSKIYLIPSSLPGQINPSASAWLPPKPTKTQLKPTKTQLKP